MKIIHFLTKLTLTSSLAAKVEVFEISKDNVNLLPGGKEADG